ncbi:MAG: PAS domain S-box protein [Candidatus Hodarchaeales archaeon]|jgi:PAS domain S-box-containing protein
MAKQTINDDQIKKAPNSSEETAKAIINASMESAMLIAPDGTILSINEIAAHRLGRDVKDTIGRIIFDLIPPEVAEARKARIEEIIITKKHIRFQDEREGIIFNNSYYPIFNDQEKAVGVAIYARDITAQRKMERALRESEEKFRELADLLPQTVFELDNEGNLTFTNQEGLEPFGYTQNNLDEGLNVLQMFIQKDRERIIDNIKRKMAGEMLGEVGRHYTALRKDGSTFPALVYSRPIIHDNISVGLRGILIDDTERREAEEALRLSREKYRTLSKFQEAILRTSFDALAVVDFLGNILFVNDTLISLSGYSGEELQTLHLSTITVGPEFATHLIESARQKQKITRLETNLIPKSAASVPVELSSGLIEEEEKVLVVFRDLRVEKELSEEIKLFRRFSTEHAFVSLFKMTSRGPEAIITEHLPFAKDEDELLLQMAIYYTTALGQGNIVNQGLFGPLPVPKTPGLVSLVYSFIVSDPTYEDPRAEGKTYAFVVLSIPESLIQLFTNRVAIQKIFEKELEKISVIQDLDMNALRKLKKKMLSFDELL